MARVFYGGGFPAADGRPASVRPAPLRRARHGGLSRVHGGSPTRLDRGRRAGVQEFAKIETLDYADLHSGHWPQFTRPDDLAKIILDRL
jgi:hypothetical protein